MGPEHGGAEKLSPREVIDHTNLEWPKTERCVRHTMQSE